MDTRNPIPCEYRENGCTDPACSIRHCEERKRTANAEAKERAAREEEIDAEARDMAPAWFRQKGIRSPSEKQIRSFIRNPKVREAAQKRVALRLKL